MEAWVIAGFLICVLALDAIATRAVLRDDGSTPAQKAMQLVLSWAVPVLGAILCLANLRRQGGSVFAPEDEIESVLDLPASRGPRIDVD